MRHMTANEYQELAARTLLADPDPFLTGEETSVAWNALGLAGEAGEVAELIKKGVFHRHGVDREKLAKELGDVLWYVAALCSNYGLSMSGVMDANIEKLRERYPDGYSDLASQARIDVLEARND